MNRESERQSPTSQSQSNPTFFYKLKYYPPSTCIQKFSFMLIRPPRFIYNEQILIPTKKIQQTFKYQTFNIPFPLSLYSVQNMKYVVLYLHGNSSSRFEGYMQLSNFPVGVGLACFDFNGCGLRSEKEFISLGKSQSAQIDTAVSFLKGKGIKVVGWGRSMGAVSLLLSSQCDVMIADSPFSSLSTLCKEIAKSQVPFLCMCFFHCLFPCLFCLVAKDVQKKTSMHPRELQVIQAVKRIPSNKSLMILAGNNDTMISYHHSQMLYDAFSGQDKRLLVFDGTHNSTRSFQVYNECFKFIHNKLQLPPPVKLVPAKHKIPHPYFESNHFKQKMKKFKQNVPDELGREQPNNDEFQQQKEDSSSIHLKPKQQSQIELMKKEGQKLDNKVYPIVSSVNIEKDITICEQG